ncbi:MAG: hypothetical protein EA425_11665 [Puniceicoccaceae bacterium]|nr:MAG: hypothetical protein EA425_11665 [Puniceicoccaceae bacterium]
MISWLQTRFQRHYKILFLVLLAVIIVAFVFTIGAAPGIGGHEARLARAEFFGIPLGSEAQQRDFIERAQISAFLQGADDIFEGNRLQEYAFERAAAVHLARELRLPEPTEGQLLDFIRGLGGFQTPDGRFDAQSYATFLDDVDANPRLSQTMISEVLVEDFLAARARRAVAGPGYILPVDVKASLAQADTIWTIAAAYVDFSDFQPEVTIDEEELENFFEENAFRYEVPERKAVRYVTFRSERYLDRVELREEEIRRHWQDNRARFEERVRERREQEATLRFDLPGGDLLAEEADEAASEEEKPVTFDDARDLVVADLRRVRSRTLATRAAADFAYMLFEDQIQAGSEGYYSRLESYGLEERETPPFAANQVPPGTGWSRTVAQEAFSLSPLRRMSDPLTVGDNTILAFYGETYPAHVPPLEDVRPRVEADFRRQVIDDMKVERGKELRSAMVAALEEGHGLEEAAEMLELDFRRFDAFTLRNPPDDMDWALMSRLDQLVEGRLTEMALQQQRGSFVLLEEKVIPEVDTDSDEFLETLERMREFTANFNERLVLSEYVNRELVRSGLARTD